MLPATIVCRYHPTAFKYESDSTTSMKLQHSLNMKNVNLYEPRNYPALIDTMMPFLKVHDILRLSTSSKKMHGAIKNYKGRIHTNNDNIISLMEHNCARCFKEAIQNCKSSLPEVFMMGCDKGVINRIHDINHVCKILFKNDANIKYPEGREKLANCTNPECNFIHTCVVYANKHKDSFKLLVFNLITKWFDVAHSETLEIICKVKERKIARNIDTEAINFIDDSIKIALPLWGMYGMVDAFIQKIKMLDDNNSNYPYLLSMIQKNYGTWEKNIVKSIFDKLVMDHIIFKEHIEFIIMLALDFGAKNNILKLITSDIDIEFKILLTPLAYSYGLSENLQFLDDTKEYNLLSINEATKNTTNSGSRTVFTSKIPVDELVQIIIDTDNNKIKKKLIFQTNDNHDFSTLTTKMRTIIESLLKKYEVVRYSGTKIIKHIINLKNLGLELKLLLVPWGYAHGITDFEFLDDTKELNLFSIQQADLLRDRYEAGPVYVSKLPIEELLEIIVNTENEHLKRELIMKIDDKCAIKKLDHLIAPIIDWLINNTSCNSNICSHVINLQNIKLKFKLLLIPTIYNYGKACRFEFLSKSKELNMFSVRESIKHERRNHYIYTNHLSNDDIFKLIIMAEKNNNIRKTLIQKINPTALECYNNNPNHESTMHDVTTHMLPKHYVHDNRVNIYEDNNVVCKYKLKIRKNKLCVDYVKKLLEIDVNCYYEIVDVISYVSRSIYHNRYQYGNTDYDLLEFITGHEKFREINPSNVIILLKNHNDHALICHDIINNHPFFAQFKEDNTFIL